MAAEPRPRPKTATNNDQKLKKAAALAKAQAAIKKNIPRAKSEWKPATPEIVHPDAPTPKRGGRVKGTPNKATVEKAKAVADIMAAAFDGLTDEEIDLIGAKKVLQLLLKAAIRGRLAHEARSLAVDLLPYEEAKKREEAPVFDPNAAPVKFTVVGGLPMKYKLELGIGGNQVQDEPEEEKPPIALG